MDRPEPPPTLYCPTCGYILNMLPEHRCPECGTLFDPNNPRLLRMPRKKASLAALLAIYLLPMLFTMAMWIVVGAGKWHRSGNWPPVSARVKVSLVAATGPIAFLHHAKLMFVAAFFALAIWTTWLWLITKPPLRTLPIWLHIILSLLWNVSGCIRVSIWV